MQKIKNIAVIAHVDHGKTTLVDELLQQSGTFEAHQEVEERAMDSDAIEKREELPFSLKIQPLPMEITRLTLLTPQVTPILVERLSVYLRW